MRGPNNICISGKVAGDERHVVSIEIAKHAASETAMPLTALDRITRLLDESASESRHFPATMLYNEGWMLRLVLDWCSSHPSAVEPFVFLPGARWYSEALLPSRFGGKGRAREGFTHADAVVGHFRLRPSGRGDIELAENATQLSVFEAKMGSLLSTGTSNAPAFNQAARNIACLAHLLSSGGGPTLQRASFTVVAPQQRIDEGAFEFYLNFESVLECVRARTHMFDGAHDQWFSEQFQPFLPSCSITAVSWEQIIDAIAAVDPRTGEDLHQFLRLCLKYNPMSRHRANTGAFRRSSRRL